MISPIPKLWSSLSNPRGMESRTPADSRLCRCPGPLHKTAQYLRTLNHLQVIYNPWNACTPCEYWHRVLWRES